MSDEYKAIEESKLELAEAQLRLAETIQKYFTQIDREVADIEGMIYEI